jgi:transcriptional regulator with XRE-family HTH domain
MGRFYENYERLCRAKGTSPSRVALDIGRSKNAAANWKANGTIPKEDELEALAEHLGCEVSDFFVPEPRTKRASDYMAYYMMLLDRDVNALEAMSEEEEALGAIGKLAASDAREADPQGEVSELDDYQEDLLAVYDALDHRDKMKLMNLVYDFAEERGVEL